MSLHMEEEMQASMVLMGVIQAPHGIKGMVRIHTFTEDAENLKSYSPFYDDDGTLFEIESMKPVSTNTVIAHLKGVHNRNEAEKLRGKSLYIPRDVLEDLSDEEYYYVDLIGLNVKDEDGNELGDVKHVQNFGAGDILEIQNDEGRTILVPFRYEFVPVVDLKKRFMIIKDWSLDQKAGVQHG